MTTDSVLADIAVARTRDDAARAYAGALRDGLTEFDWPRINEAVMAKWSKSGLSYVKARAWDEVGG